MPVPVKEELARVAENAARESGHAIELTGVAGFGPTLNAARFALANGLTIVLMPDHRAPIFAYQTWFRVGSKHEDPSRTGIAHLFEHLMFKGTKTRATGTFDREMERRGSQTNAATWVDWTYYHEALAVRGDNLATVIGFESDRMVNLVLDKQTFDSELEVVKNERRMSVDNSVGGALSERLYGLAYTTHPYRWPTIGSMSHLEATSLEDLERFYRTYYAPNNAVVVVAGDLDPVATLVMLARAYAPIASQPVPKRVLPREPEQREARHAVIERPIAAAQLVIAYRAPSQIEAGYHAIELLGEALTSGDTARLYRRLVTDEKLCTEIDGGIMPFAEPGLYEVFATLRPGVEPERVLDVVQEEVERVASGLADDEIDKARNGLELGFLDSWQTAEGAAESLGHYQANYGDFGLAFNYLDKLARVTPADMAAAARQVFRKEQRTSVVALGSGEPEEGDEASDG